MSDRSIKLIFCLKRHHDLSAEEFSDYWLQHHAPLVRLYASALNIRRYTQSHSFPASAAAALAAARGARELQFDGVAELWFDSWDSFIAPSKTPEGQAAGLALLEDERKFIDLPNSPIFIARENAII